MKYLPHIVLLILEVFAAFLIFTMSDKWRNTGVKPQNYLKCPYLYLMILIGDIIYLTVSNVVLNAILTTILALVFWEIIERYVRNM